MPEGFATYFTSKGPGPTMRPSYMDLQAMGSGEYLKNKMSVIFPGGSFVYIFDFDSFSLILSFRRPCNCVIPSTLILSQENEWAPISSHMHCTLRRATETLMYLMKATPDPPCPRGSLLRDAPCCTSHSGRSPCRRSNACCNPEGARGLAGGGCCTG